MIFLNDCCFKWIAKLNLLLVAVTTNWLLTTYGMYQLTHGWYRCFPWGWALIGCTSGTWWLYSIDTYTIALDGLFGTLITDNLFMVAFVMLSAAQTVGLNGRLHNGKWIERSVEGSGCGQNLGNILPFSWRDWGKSGTLR